MVGIIVMLAVIAVCWVVMISQLTLGFRDICDALKAYREDQTIPHDDADLKRYVAAVYESKSAREYTDAANRLMDWARREIQWPPS